MALCPVPCHSVRIALIPDVRQRHQEAVDVHALMAWTPASQQSLSRHRQRFTRRMHLDPVRRTSGMCRCWTNEKQMPRPCPRERRTTLPKVRPASSLKKQKRSTSLEGTLLTASTRNLQPWLLVVQAPAPGVCSPLACSIALRVQFCSVTVFVLVPWGAYH